MAVQEPGDGWWDQTSEIAGAVWDDLKRVRFLWFYLFQCVFSLSLGGSPTNHFALQYVEFIAPQAVPFIWCTMKWAL